MSNPNSQARLFDDGAADEDITSQPLLKVEEGGLSVPEAINPAQERLSRADRVTIGEYTAAELFPPRSKEGVVADMRAVYGRATVHLAAPLWGKFESSPRRGITEVTVDRKAFEAAEQARQKIQEALERSQETLAA